MALGRPRNSKRSSSSSSYTSTATTVLFIALCVFCIWMLTSDSVLPPRPTSRTATTSPTDTLKETRPTTKPNRTKDPPAFEDNPGDLPLDAIKSDDEAGESSKSQRDKKSESLSQNSKDSNVKNGGDGLNEKQDSLPGLLGKESAEDQEKQRERENQISDENSSAQIQKPTETSLKGDSESEENKKTSNEESEGNQKVEEGNQKLEEGTTTQEQTKISEDSKNSQEPENQKPGDRDQQQDGISNANKNLQDAQNRITTDDDQEQRLKEQLREDQSRENTQETRKEEQQFDETSDEKSGTKQQQIEFQDVTKEVSQQSEKPVNDQEPQPNEGEKQEAQKQQENEEAKPTESNTGESFPGGANSVIPKESKESKKSWSTQAAQSENEKERRKDDSNGNQSIYGYSWQLCNVTAGADYIPCLDNEKALKKLRTTKHFQHRERHCPEEGPTCLVPLPENYKTPIEWPKSRDKIWYHNVPHAKLAEVKGHQNWVKMTGEFLTFPGGGTQFIHGALHYIDYLQQSAPEIAWGKHTRVILDVGCGVASFGGFLFDRDVLTMSFAPKDEHEAQVQFALERGIPAISAVMGSQRLPFPSRVFDLVHCARCRVPWHVEGGMLLLELNRVLRPGGFFVWSATPVYQKLQEDVEIWNAMSKLTASLCWELVVITKDKVNSIGAAIFRKPSSNECYDQREQKRPPMCKDDDDSNAAWYVPLQACMHRVPVDEAERGTRWPEAWPRRLQTPPYWLNSSQMGIYGKPAPQDFAADHKHWKHVVSKSYVTSLGISWSNVRNVMDMRAVYGGFAAALRDLKVWVMNVVNIDSPDTLPIIYERGLFGIYHDWCESFSTYPRTYDLLHADHLFSKLKKRCNLTPVLAEVDRMVRPGGKFIVRDESSTIGEIENLLKSLHWEVRLTFSKNKEGLLSAQKGNWRPETNVESS